MQRRATEPEPTPPLGRTATLARRAPPKPGGSPRAAGVVARRCISIQAPEPLVHRAPAEGRASASSAPAHPPLPQPTTSAVRPDLGPSTARSPFTRTSLAELNSSQRRERPVSPSESARPERSERSNCGMVANAPGRRAEQGAWDGSPISTRTTVPVPPFFSVPPNQGASSSDVAMANPVSQQSSKPTDVRPRPCITVRPAISVVMPVSSEPQSTSSANG